MGHVKELLRSLCFLGNFLLDATLHCIELSAAGDDAEYAASVRREYAESKDMVLLPLISLAEDDDAPSALRELQEQAAQFALSIAERHLRVVVCTL